MRKLVAGLIVGLILGAGGYFGVDYWAQTTVAREVDSVLDGWRASVGSATRGRIEVDLWTRTVKITDVVIQPRSGSHPKLTVGQIVASGLDISGKPGRVELFDVAMTDTLPGQPGTEMVQTAPRVILAGFTTRPLALRKVNTALDGARLWLEQFSAITADRIEIPSLTVVQTQDNRGLKSAHSYSQYTYTNLVLTGVRDGRIAEATADGITLNGNIGPPFFVLKGEIGKSTVLDVDVAPLLAFLDRSRKTEGYQRVYRRVSVGPYALQMGIDKRTGMTIRIDGVVAEDVGMDPTKLSLDDLTFLSEITSGASGAPGGMPFQPGQMTMLLDKVAGVYEGLSLGKLKVDGLSVSGMRDQFKIASISIERMENGKLGALSFDGMDAKPPFGDPVSFGRVAFKGFDIANFMRAMGLALSAPPGQPPPFDRLAGMSNLLEGFELKGIEVPDPKTRRKMRIDASVMSGQVVGSLPTEARGSFKVSIPLSLPAPDPIGFLIAAGFTTLAAEADMGVRWTEATETLTLEPVTLEVAGVMAVSAKAAFGKVGRDIYGADMMKAMQAVIEVDAGPIEVTLRDLGIVDLLAAEIARSQGLGPDAGRRLLLEKWRLTSEMQIQLHPSAKSFFDAVARFLESKGETLTVRLTPKGRVRLAELAEAFRLAPDNALLAAFNLEASTGK